MLVMFLLRETVPTKSNKTERMAPSISDLGLMLTHRFFLRNALTNMFCFATFVIFISNFPYLMTSNYEFSPWQNGAALSLISCCLAVGVFSVRVLVPKIGIQKTVYVGIYLLAGFWLLILILQLVSVQTLYSYIVPGFFCSFSLGIILSLLPGQAMVPFSDNAGAASSVFGILQYGGSASLAYLSGIYFESTLLTVTIAMTLCAGMTLFSYWFFGK
jgi:DHA1 family bicyclomycin/chloramphenicol resistance-like MFS transporter